MSGKTIGIEGVRLEQIRVKMEETTLNSVRKILPDEAIRKACRETGYRFRKRVLTPTVTILHMMLAAIWPEESFAASWQVMWDSVVSKLPSAAGRSPSKGSVSKARMRLPLELWEHLFLWLSQKTQKLSADFERWHSHRIVLIDGTCMSMSDEEELFKEFGTSNGHHGNGKYPLARLVTLAFAETMTMLGYRVGGYKESEQALMFPLLDPMITKNG